MKAHLQSRVLPVNMIRRDLPPSLADWLMAMLARDVDDRPSDATVAFEALRVAMMEEVPEVSDETSEEAEYSDLSAVG